MGTLQCPVTMVELGHGLTLTLKTPAYETLAEPLGREARLQGPFRTPALPRTSQSHVSQRHST